MDHLIFNRLLNLHQSTYCKHHFTETAILYIHNYLINAVRSRKVSCLCLLDHSAAFDTIDHNILITCPSSWFGIHSSVIDWFKSYLSSRSLGVKCDNILSFLYTSSCGVPQGFVLGLLLFIIYTTPISTLISSLSLNHHLCADELNFSSLFTLLTLTPLQNFVSADLFLDDCKPSKSKLLQD